ncbi:MAG TPA: zinc ribbon domain-containing protein [Gemmatimonadales bacterium]|nr:zinc ribbon domain-containing protein [Gemmatimonadales bacterium]
MTCHACGTALPVGVRFCHKCGAPVAIATAGGWRVGLPWGIAGAALGALVTLLLTRAAGAGAGAAPAPALGSAPPPAGQIAAPDISRMSPQERAERLFDRVVDLAQRGVQDSVQFFMPMALGAYEQLPTLDLDDHYDLGVLHVVGNDAAGALAEADTILAAVPTHLYGFMLRAQGLALKGDQAGARKAYAAFLANERAERARQRPEYTPHVTALDAFHTEATTATTPARPAR